MQLLKLAVLACVLQGCVMPVLGDGDPVAFNADSGPRAVVPLLLSASDGTLCNAVRIGPNRAATAAHCLDAAVPYTLAGGGATVPVLGGRANPAYARLDAAMGAAADLAVLRIPNDGAGYVVIGTIQPGPVTIRARDPAGRSLSRGCTFLGRAGGLVELGCAIPLGWSGAPVTQNGALVGIVSSRGQGAASGVTQIADAARIDSF